MSGLSRRDLLRASAGAAAVAVPMSVLSSHGSAGAAATSSTASAGAASVAAEAAELDRLVGPVMFSITDAKAGEVSILHGSSEVIVHDRQLVDRIMRAARRTL